MKKTIFIVFSCIPLLSLSQQGSVSTGGDIQSPNGSISYSIGQPFIQFSISQDGNINEGIQQAYFSTNLNVESLNENQIVVYPNPFQNNLNIKLDKAGSYSFRLIGNDGRSILAGQFSSIINTISLESVAVGNYILEINNTYNNQTFKITKN